MRRVGFALVAWSARIVGWAVVLLLLTYVVVNYEGTGLRGQYARWLLPSERYEAERNLLQRAGLDPQQYAVFNEFQASEYLFSGPFRVLSKTPLALQLTPRGGYGYGQPSERYVCFGREGRLLGAPVDPSWLAIEGQEAPTFRAVVQEVVDFGSLRFMVLRAHVPTLTTTTPATPSGTVSVLRVFQIAFPESSEVLAIRRRTGPWEWDSLTIRQEREGAVSADLAVRRGSPGGGLLPPSQTVASFPWDSTRGRFTGSTRDSLGLWEMVYPPPQIDGGAR